MVNHLHMHTGFWRVPPHAEQKAVIARLQKSVCTRSTVALFLLVWSLFPEHQLFLTATTRPPAPHRTARVLQDKNKYNSPKYRLVVRFTNKYVLAQIIYATIRGDVVSVSASGCATWFPKLPSKSCYILNGALLRNAM